MKKVISILCVLVISLCSLTSVRVSLANDVDCNNIEDAQEIIKILYDIEPVKETYNLNDQDISKLCIMEPIFGYECLNNKLCEIIKLYPVFSKGELVLFALQGSDGVFQVTTGLVSELKTKNLEHCALLYDRTNCYYYDGTEYEAICNYNREEVSSRGYIDTINLSNKTIWFTSSPLTVLADLSEMHLTMTPKRSSTSVCYVSYVPQGQGTALCWAASTACIYNYLSGSSYSALNMAALYYGCSPSSVPPHVGMNAYAVAGFMLNNLGILYSHQVSGLAPSVIQHNISSGYPMYGVFQWSSGTHAVTIYHHESLNNMISVMDPEYGASSVNYVSGNYNYTSAYSGVSLTLIEWISRYYY